MPSLSGGHHGASCFSGPPVSYKQVGSCSGQSLVTNGGSEVPVCVNVMGHAMPSPQDEEAGDTRLSESTVTAVAGIAVLP